jgi:hypothetical protein
VAETVCQVGADGGRDARSEAPPRQGWHGLVAPVGVEDEHAGGQDEAVDGERQESRGDAGLVVGADEFVGMAVGDDRRHRGDGGHGQCGGDPDEPACHRNSSRSASGSGDRPLWPAAAG